MSEMVDRVAKAIFEQRYNAPGTHQFLPWEQYVNQEIYRADARAAIEAMREPTQAMFDAGYPHARERYTEGVWEAMIDAALAQPVNNPNNHNK